MQRDRHRCIYCGQPAAHIDHMIPVSRGGDPYDESNLAASCAGCNQAKGSAPAPL